MKLASYQKGREPSIGIVWGEKLIDFNQGIELLPQRPIRLKKFLPLRDMRRFLELGAITLPLARRIWGQMEKNQKDAAQIKRAFPKLFFDLRQVRLLPPIPNPPKMICLARNYVSHAREVAGEAPLPKSLLAFMKPTTAIIGPGDSIVIPPSCQKLDHEVELAVVIGKKGKYIPEEKAMEHVAGYTIFNDVSDREYILQPETGRVNWFFMKAPDTFAPMGPYLVLREGIEDPHQLRLRLWVNGDLRQDSSGEDMIFKIPAILSILSRFVTLEPGDVIATGTPTGTSFSTKQFLRDGDVVECEIEGLGRLRNIVRMERPVYRAG